MDKKILITGGAGYIGSHTVKFLTTQGIKLQNIIVFDNLIYGHKEVLPKDVIFIKGDLLNKSQINQVFHKFKIDKVIHFAAYAYVGESMKNPGKYFENNILAGLNLLEAMIEGNSYKIVFSSTCATYGIPKSSPIDESFNQKPINPYGESKLMFEKILEWYAHLKNIKSVRLRYFNACGAAYGIGEWHNPETHLIPLVLKSALDKNRAITIFGTDYNTQDGTCVRDYIHVVDLARAHWQSFDLLDKEDFKTDYFNLGTGKGVSVKEIIDLTKKITNINFKVNIGERRLGDPDALVANPAKANQILGWKADFSIEKVIESAWQWEQNLLKKEN